MKQKQCPHYDCCSFRSPFLQIHLKIFNNFSLKPKRNWINWWYGYNLLRKFINNVELYYETLEETKSLKSYCICYNSRKINAFKNFRKRATNKGIQSKENE